VCCRDTAQRPLHAETAPEMRRDVLLLQCVAMSCSVLQSATENSSKGVAWGIASRCAGAVCCNVLQ